MMPDGIPDPARPPGMKTGDPISPPGGAPRGSSRWDAHSHISFRYYSRDRCSPIICGPHPTHRLRRMTHSSYSSRINLVSACYKTKVQIACIRRMTKPNHIDGFLRFSGAAADSPLSHARGGEQNVTWTCVAYRQSLCLTVDTRRGASRDIGEETRDSTERRPYIGH